LEIFSAGIFLPLIIVLAKVFFNDNDWQKIKEIALFTLFSGLMIDLLSGAFFPTVTIILILNLGVALILQKTIIAEKQFLIITLAVFMHSMIFDFLFLLLSHELTFDWQIMKILVLDAGLSMAVFWIIIYLSSKINPRLDKKRYHF
jgi:EamA domain-containing membrane protein RarD